MLRDEGEAHDRDEGKGLFLKRLHGFLPSQELFLIKVKLQDSEIWAQRIWVATCTWLSWKASCGQPSIMKLASWASHSCRYTTQSFVIAQSAMSIVCKCVCTCSWQSTFPCSFILTHLFVNPLTEHLSRRCSRTLYSYLCCCLLRFSKIFQGQSWFDRTPVWCWLVIVSHIMFPCRSLLPPVFLEQNKRCCKL